MTDAPRPGFNALRDKMLQHLEVHRAAKLEDLAQAVATFAYEALYLPGSPDVPHVQRTAPRRIYLCVSDDPDDHDEPFSEVRAEVTWARDEATRVAVPYVRADLVNAGTAVADERAAFEAAILARPGCTQVLLRRRDAPGSARPGEYVQYAIQLCWEVWQARAALAAPKAEAPTDGLQVVSYVCRVGDQSFFINRVNPKHGGDRWKVSDGIDVLNADGAWEPERPHSSRDEAFLARCRFDTAGAALAVLKRALSAPPTHQGATQ